MADSLEQRILSEGPDTVAAMIAEPIMGAGGVHPASRDILGENPGGFKKIRCTADCR